MFGTLDPERIQSEALNKNMDLTNIEVVVPSLFEVLQEAVKGYAGKEKQARELLIEYHHKYLNWEYVIQETWRYAISNVRLYKAHPLNGIVVFLLAHILLEALKGSERTEVRNLAADHLLAFWMKMADELADELSQPLPEGLEVRELGLYPERISHCHQGILRYYLVEIANLPEVPFEHVMRSYHQLKRLGRKLLKIWPNTDSFPELRTLLQRLYGETCRFWLEREDPCQWLEEQFPGLRVQNQWRKACAPLSHETFRSTLDVLDEEIAPLDDHRSAVQRLIELQDFQEIVKDYFKLPDELKACEDDKDLSHLSMLMRLKIMEVRGLEGIHEEMLRSINFEMAKSLRQEEGEKLQAFLKKILEILNTCLRNYPEAALQIIRTMGLEVVETKDPKLIEFFLLRIIHMGFQTPQLGGVTQTWQMEVNPAHLPNIRVWLDIIKKNPQRTKILLSALIVNLSLGGIYIRDTDLFQKDVSQLLHAPIRPAYNLVKQLAKLFPVYFNQIGAEGQLRAVSTDVDEITGRSDRLIHFLRKQSHVESNNVVVSFIEAIVEFWRSLDKTKLKDLVPAEIYPEIATKGPLVDEVHTIMKAVFKTPSVHHVRDLLDLPEAEALSIIDKVPGVSEGEKRRAFLLIQFYQLLHEKYALSFKDIHVHLQRAAGMGLPDPGRLIEALDSEDPMTKLKAILDYLLELREVILRPSEMHILENIYYKRHIAVDIPSMYGTYNEHKFDALGLTFRLESLANVLFEEIIYSFNLSFITRATFFRIAKFLPLFTKALAIDGITSNRLERQAELFEKALEVRRFSHSQYIDIFRGFSEAIKQIIQANYHAIHEVNLDLILKQLGKEKLLCKYQREFQSESEAVREHRVSECFLRDLIARTFGLQYFDHFISSILTTLATQKEMLSAEKLDLLLSYDPEKTVTSVDRPNRMVYDLIHLGNKGYTLANLHAIGIKTPPAFAITTEYFRCRSVIESLSQSSRDFRDRVMEHIEMLEKKTGRGFGNPANVLLLSVRSGAAVSMPGMMNTFLNVGINEAVVEGLIAETREKWFAWDNYRRFIQSWGMSFGMQRDVFDAIMYKQKKKYQRGVKREFNPDEIQEVALQYKKALKDHNVRFSDSPEEQLFTAIRKVVESWHSPKAKTYRDIMGLSENWGTAVTIQAMVFGNLDQKSGAGVMFTHNPKTSEDEVDPVGDFTLGNQGEDVVGGLVKTLPLSEKQRLAQEGGEDQSLESLFPRVYGRLVQIARELTYGQHWSPQEVEFTFQGPEEDGVYVLQSRNMVTRVRRAYPVFKPTDALQSSYVGNGIGVSGGALSGMAAFDLDSIKRMRFENPGKGIILIRSDTVPDDIHEISITDGILTGKGGATSHAAIVAHRLGKTCVVGFSKMRVYEGRQACVIEGPDQREHELRSGDHISIDGRSGAVYLGLHESEKIDMPT